MMLDDKTKPVDKLELNQFKNSNPKAWPSARVHDLFLWSKSMSQFRSVLMNMSHMEWLRVKDSIANGQFAPKKAASVIPTQIIPAGELGFHGCTLASAIKNTAEN